MPRILQNDWVVADFRQAFEHFLNDVPQLQQLIVGLKLFIMHLLPEIIQKGIKAHLSLRPLSPSIISLKILKTRNLLRWLISIGLRLSGLLDVFLIGLKKLAEAGFSFVFYTFFYWRFDSLDWSVAPEHLQIMLTLLYPIMHILDLVDLGVHVVYQLFLHNFFLIHLLTHCLIVFLLLDFLEAVLLLLSQWDGESCCC